MIKAFFHRALQWLSSLMPTSSTSSTPQAKSGSDSFRGDGTIESSAPKSVTNLGIGAAIRAGQAKVAHTMLQSWRERYLRSRRNAVRLALSRLGKEGCAKEEQRALIALLEDTEADAATAPLVTRADGRTLQLSGVASFRQQLTLRSRRAQLASSGPEWRLNSKDKGLRFARKQGIPCPKIYARNVQANQLDFHLKSVIKPANGAASRGVYLVLEDGTIFEPSRNQELQGEQALRDAIQKDLASNRVYDDRWIVEELITEDSAGIKPGCDLKFYCFYGEVGLVLEVERAEKNRYCEWDGHGNFISTGKYIGCEFDGRGVDSEQLALAKELSLAIPAPFMRIDFIRSYSSPEGMVFCEFTPRPGNFHRFNLATDRRLGDLYLEAEARLERDLLCGKKFENLFIG